jgi:hypothetical protein
VNLDTALWLIAAVAEACVLSLLLYRRQTRILPVFCTYIAWAVVSDITVFILNHRFPDAQLRVYTIQTAIEAMMQFAVLVELAWSVLRPVRASLPKGAIVVLAAVIAVAGLCIWPLAGKAIPVNILPQARTLVQLVQTIAILRVGCFLVMASFSQVLSIGWRDRELQIATGLGFYSIVTLIVSILQTHPLPEQQYQWLDRAGVASYVFSLSYWVLSFAAQEQKRKEFTPQMQQLLLLMGGGARTSRIALTGLSSDRLNQKDK